MKFARVFACAIAIFLISASIACATTVHLYADTAPNSSEFDAWKAAAFSAAATGSLVNMTSGRYPGTANFLSREALVYSGGDFGKRLHWVYWLPGETVTGLADRFQVKDVSDWDAVAYAGDDIDGPEVGWVAPTSWIDYDSNGDGTDDGVIGTFGNAWWPEYDEEIINAMAGDMLGYQSYWKGVVRVRDSVTDPWQTSELQLNLVSQPSTIIATIGSGGSITPIGTIAVAYGGSQTYTITPSLGFITTSVMVDGVEMGAIAAYTFTNVISDHTIAATFGVAPSLTITASAEIGGSISPSGSVSVTYGGSQAFSITANGGYTVKDVLVDNASVGAVASYTFSNATANHTISALFSAIVGDVPREDQLVKSWINDALPASGAAGNLASYLPAGETFAKMGSPIAETIKGVKWINNRKASGDGFDLGLFASTYAMPCSGASVVMAVKPVRDGIHGDWQACFNIFTYTLSFGIRNDTGNICARRNSTLYNYPNAIIPDGQTTILSLIVQPSGTFKVYANGTQIVSETAAGAFTQLAPTWSTSDSMRHINLGRANGSTWSCFNGYIGDTYFYKVALTDAERQQLEAQLTSKFMPPAYEDVATITDLKAKPDGTPVRVIGTKTVIYAPKNATGSRTTAFFYIGEKQGLGGLKVVDKTGDTLALGDLVSNITGYFRAPVGKEPYLELTTDVTGTGNAPIQPMGVNNKTALTDAKALTNTVKIWGKIKSVNGTTSFVISDGYADPGVNVIVNGVALPAGFDGVNCAVVTGILTVDDTGKIIIQAQSVNAP